MKKLLLVDDELHRAQSIKSVMPSEITAIWAQNAGLGIQALRAEKFDILLLDHDLYHESGSGEDVAKVVAETQNPTCKIFIHSQNEAGANAMRQLLSGFEISRSAWDNGQRMAPGLPEWLKAQA